MASSRGVGVDADGFERWGTVKKISQKVSGAQAVCSHEGVARKTTFSANKTSKVRHPPFAAPRSKGANEEDMRRRKGKNKSKDDCDGEGAIVISQKDFEALMKEKSPRPLQESTRRGE